MKLLTSLVAVGLLCLSSSAVLAAPRCNIDDEDCRDRAMHPDLPVTRLQSPFADGEDTNDYWRKQGEEFVKQKMTLSPNQKKAKNVIMFLGDGMGLTTVAATRNIMGGEAAQLAFEKFPFTGLSKTYAVDKIVPDSACTATAYLCGIKGNEGTIGVNGFVNRGNCTASKDPQYYVYSIAKSAMDEGKWAGVVTTTRITHASPAGVYAHVAERDWEDDTEVAIDCNEDSGVEDIAYQLINGEVGKGLKVMLGGGRKRFLDAENKGSRSDGLNLVEVFKNQNAENVYVETLDQLNNVDLKDNGRLLGLFQDSHMLYHLETNENTNQPTLEEMTRKAIEILSENDEGYFIFIEGGRIDLAHHDNMARLALDETVEFSKAIQAAKEMTSEEDTLIVVTADHSHAFSFSGYPYRGADIFARVPATPEDGVPHMTLTYANGPSFEKFYDVKNGGRIDPTTVITGDKYDVFPATFPLDSETHGGEDVAVFASGPWAHLFSGVYDQNAIPHIMAYASCLGDGRKFCPAD